MPGKADKKPYSLDATILFIDLMNSVALSNTLTLGEYNTLINDYQEILRAVVDKIRNDYPVGEYYLGGDQLAVFFYDPDEAGKYERVDKLKAKSLNSPTARKLQQELEHQRSRCLYGALRCAVQVKNAWVGHSRNIARVMAHQPVMDVGVGINTGRVVYQERGDGQKRIEGFAINFAKRVEGYSRHGLYCKIMLSKAAYETFRGTVVGHSMLKQRAFFEPYTPAEGLLKGLAPGTKVYELKFFHRLAGFSIPPDRVELYTQIFKIDATNIWAYSNLLNYHLYTRSDIKQARELAHRALYSNPYSEKILYDLGCINLALGELETAEQHCRRCLDLNSEMEYAYDLLAEIELKGDRDWNKVLKYRAQSLSLAPDSAASHLDLAMALVQVGNNEGADKHLRRALKLYPDVLRLISEEIYSAEEINQLVELSESNRAEDGD